MRRALFACYRRTYLRDQLPFNGPKVQKGYNYRTPSLARLCERNFRKDSLRESSGSTINYPSLLPLTPCQVPSISFAPSHLLALLSVGRITGLVLDCGELESTALPVRCLSFFLSRFWADTFVTRYFPPDPSSINSERPL